MKKNKGNTSISRELDRAALYKQATAKQITDTSRLLESPEHKKRVQLMRDLKWDQTITRVETMVGSERERSDLMQKLGHTDVSKLEEIEEIAVTYGLKFLPAKKFLCPERCEDRMSSLIDYFLKEKGISNGYSESAFYILADPRYFLKRQYDINDEIGAHIFYLPPKETQNYLRVDSFGEGRLTLWRYMRGWRQKEPLNGIFHVAVVTFFSALPVFYLMTSGFVKAFLFSVVATVGACYLFIDAMKKKGGFSTHTWNQDPKDNG